MYFRRWKCTLSPKDLVLNDKALFGMKKKEVLLAEDMEKRYLNAPSTLLGTKLKVWGFYAILSLEV